MTPKRQSVGLAGSLFVSACCLGAGPILAGLAAALGFSAFHSILNVYVLLPLMTVSVLWVVWNLRIQGNALAGSALRYPPFWSGLIGGSVAWVGVLLPHVVAGTKHVGTDLIIVGMALFIGASLWSVIDQRRRLGASARSA
ncbi:hypothetical protein U879_21215 [Defluviimonas sp. 20V17]|uniref:Uncharacterized protein n=1 Tax=Allgaiera indica TaxID=765699 RepID=A0AAN5A0D0_9RHOB|nr:hypothetical protein [Allgaiera indica]KDB01667.1 hypothetical protein U879_21215 [Defluviimonas sp. 20V17]GHE03954.1 hypothetical protein GCM10008024_29210 [Allgaiera indica]SDX35084.1 hypothetical protein SAMN05444006_11459 [Allgaiera indica]